MTRPRHPLAIALAAISAPIWSGVAVAQVPVLPSKTKPTPEACRRLASGALSSRWAKVTDAPTIIQSARVAPAGGHGAIDNDIPEICEVEGQITPTIGFLLRMPTQNWNGKFMMGGCGGPCGNYLIDRIDPALKRNYAVVTTDMGHVGGGWGFANNNLQAMIDFGYRSTHATAVIAKEMIAEYYGEPASKNYFWGCSTGGRQALIEAQRFPDDFDGILAGAPPWSQTGHQPLAVYWPAKSNVDATGRGIVDTDKLPLIHAAVMGDCDKLDGLVDGQLQNPLACKWDPATIECAGAEAKTCLTKAEVAVVRAIYDGPVDSKGRSLYPGQSRGTELAWKGYFIGENHTPGAGFNGANTTAHYLAFYPSTPGYELKSFDYDKDPARLAMNDAFFKHNNPDLTAFKARGGKIILYHGWNDNIPPRQAIDYYEKVTRTMGGATATRDFARLFMMPAMDHCRGGSGEGEVDWISTLETWVEQGQAPDSVTAYHLKAGYPSAKLPNGDNYLRLTRHPLASDAYDRSKPVYAYPDVAHYSGKGDPNQASSWRKAKP